jgi:DNA-binding NarL/FixJ family response regulator
MPNFMNDISVYIVEDEAVIALTLSRFLRNNGFQITGQSDNAEEAYPEILETNPDVLLVDIFLADDTDGIQLVKSLGDPRPATIFITGNSDNATRSRAMQLNPSGYIVKPINMDHLVRVIESSI